MEDPILTFKMPLSQARLISQALGVVLNLMPERDLPILEAGRDSIAAAVRREEIREQDRKQRAA